VNLKVYGTNYHANTPLKVPERAAMQPNRDADRRHCPSPAAPCRLENTVAQQRFLGALLPFAAPGLPELLPDRYQQGLDLGICGIPRAVA
jgi:hypothetical protein